MKTSILNLLIRIKSHINSVVLLITLFGFQAQATILNTNPKSKLNDSGVINAGMTLLKCVAPYSINGPLLYQNSQVNASLTTITTGALSIQPIIIKVTTHEGILFPKSGSVFSDNTLWFLG
jgi:hypothetical protein